jgi:hypothetical protein
MRLTYEPSNEGGISAGAVLASVLAFAPWTWMMLQGFAGPALEGYDGQWMRLGNLAVDFGFAPTGLAIAAWIVSRSRAISLRERVLLRVVMACAASWLGLVALSWLFPT